MYVCIQYSSIHVYIWQLVNVLMCRVRAPQRGENVSGLAARQKAKLGRILEQVHSDIITERQRGTYMYIHVCIGHTLHMTTVEWATVECIQYLHVHVFV